ncbi:hypothetical protein RB601_000676 [Gaeumannomyces tritici]
MFNPIRNLARGATSIFRAPKIIDRGLSTADRVVLDPNGTLRKFRDGARATMARASSLLLGYAVGVFAAAADWAGVDVIVKVAHRPLDAVRASLGGAAVTVKVARRSLDAVGESLVGAAVIVTAIYSNCTNKDTLHFILHKLPELLRFLYDLVRPGTVIPGFLAAGDGGVIEEETMDGSLFPGAYNPYDELDLGQDKNRRAVVYQLLRVALSLVAILEAGRAHPTPKELPGLRMNTRLGSDFEEDGMPPSPTYDSRLAEMGGGGGGSATTSDERWLFVNGIANERVWFQGSCDKIRDTFQRDVRGVYNRSDGFLWDLIECAGERSAAAAGRCHNELIQRTKSSTSAQKELKAELERALWPPADDPPAKVVMIAHSQGCLLLRLVLQTLVLECGHTRRADMRQRLRVFTFGNPCVDWRVAVDGGTGRFLSEYAWVTEHFAHTADFVARLGVVGHQPGYDKDSVFYSKGGKGHLFGAHYPLGMGSYHNGKKSVLLKAVSGDPIA